MKIDNTDISNWGIILESKEGIKRKIKISELKQALDEITLQGDRLK